MMKVADRKLRLPRAQLAAVKAGCPRANAAVHRILDHALPSAMRLDAGRHVSSQSPGSLTGFFDFDNFTLAGEGR